MSVKRVTLHLCVLLVPFAGVLAGLDAMASGQGQLSRWASGPRVVGSPGMPTAHLSGFGAFDQGLAPLGRGNRSRGPANGAPPPKPAPGNVTRPASALSFTRSALAHGSRMPLAHLGPLRLQRSFTNAFSNTYVASDGVRVARVYAQPINFRGLDGQWQAIDNALVRTSGGFENRADAYRVRFPSSLGASPISVRSGRWHISMRLLGAASQPVKVTANEATYADALPGVRAVYRAEADAVQESLVLPNANAGRRFTVLLRLGPGLTATMAHESVAIVNRAGTTEFVLPAPALTQSPTSAVPSPPGAVALSLRRVSGGAALTYTPDERWLRAASRRYPVVLDPSVALTQDAGADCMITTAAPTSDAYCGYGVSDGVGVDTSGNEYRTLISFKGLVSSIPADSLILGSSVSLDVYASAGTTGYGVLPMSRAFVPGEASWDYYNGTEPWSIPGGDYISTPPPNPVPDTQAIGTVSVAGSTHFDITALTQSWIDGSAVGGSSTVDPSLMITPVTAAGNAFDFYNVNADGSGYSGPYIQVEYSSRMGDAPGATLDSTPLNQQATLGVNVANGDLMLTNTDLSITGTGLDETIDRTYNSLSGQEGLFGYGWGPTYGMLPVLYSYTPDALGLTMPDDSTYVWNTSPLAPNVFLPPAGLDAQLCSVLVGNCTPKNGAAAFELTFDNTGEKWDFNVNGYLIAQYDRNGNVISYAYTRSDPSAITDTQNRVTDIGYASSGFISGLTDTAGSRSTSYGQNSAGDLTSYTDAAGNKTTYTYNGAGDLTQIVNPGYEYTDITYDSSGRVTSVLRMTGGTLQQPTGPTTTYQYGAGTGPGSGYPSCGSAPGGEGQYGWTLKTDPDTHWTLYCYDTHDRVYETINQYDESTITTQNADDDVTSVEDPDQQTTTNSYDGCFRYTGTTEPATGSAAPASTTVNYPTCTSSPASYLRSSSTDAQGNTTSYQYDGNGNLTQVKDGLAAGSNTTTFTYNSNGTVHTSTTPDGNLTTYGYDSPGNLTSVTPPNPLNAQSFTYDPDSREKTVTDGDGNTTSYSYDPDDNVKVLSYADGSTITNTYDGNGNLTQQADSANGTASYKYNVLNLLTSETDPGAGGQPSTTTSYTYNGDGQIATLADGGGTVTYTYDSANRLSTVQQPTASQPISFGYDIDSRLTCLTYPNGVVVQDSYDNASDLLSTQAANGTGAACNPNSSTGTPTGNVISDYTYGYNLNNQATALRQTEQINGTTWYNSYDALNRLLTSTTGTGEAYNFSYDGDGNMLTRTTNAQTGATQTMTYNADDEMCWADEGSVSGSPACTAPPQGDIALSYDNAGQMTALGSAAFGYNTREQTTSINATGAGAQTIGYRGEGQSQPTQIGNQPTGGAAPSLEEDILGVSGEEGAVASGGSPSNTYYTRADDGQLLSERAPTGTYYYVLDGNGSVVALTDSSGNVVNTYAYDPYGLYASHTGTAPNIFGFDSGVQMTGGMWLFGDRYFNSFTGTWTQRDPDQLELVTDPAQANPYVFAADDPVNNVDSDGDTVRVRAAGYCASVVLACIASHKTDEGFPRGPEHHYRPPVVEVHASGGGGTPSGGAEASGDGGGGGGKMGPAGEDD